MNDKQLKTEIYHGLPVCIVDETEDGNAMVTTMASDLIRWRDDVLKDAVYGPNGISLQFIERWGQGRYEKYLKPILDKLYER